MRVELAGDVFTEDGFALIIVLMRQFIESRHHWVVDLGQLDLVDEYFQDYAPKHAPVFGEVARKGLVSQAWSSPQSRPSVVSVTGQTLADHVEDLGRPAKFVVENRDGDGEFLLALAYVFGAEEILKACEEKWLEIVQGGGSGEVPKVVRHENAAFRRLKRVAFLLDSDRMTPDEVSKHEETAAELRAEGIDGHILRFREVENYVPDRVLEQERAMAGKVVHLKALVPEQRAHFDMKKGFYDGKRKQIVVPAAQKSLFASLDDATKAGLQFGFGKGLMEILGREAKAGHLKESDFEKIGPGVCDELEALLALLRQII